MLLLTTYCTRMSIYLSDTICGTNANGMHACLRSFYDKTLAALKSSQNERLWFKTNMKLAKLWFDKHEFHRLQVGVRACACVCMCVPSCPSRLFAYQCTHISSGSDGAMGTNGAADFA